MEAADDVGNCDVDCVGDWGSWYRITAGVDADVEECGGKHRPVIWRSLVCSRSPHQFQPTTPWIGPFEIFAAVGCCGAVVGCETFLGFGLCVFGGWCRVRFVMTIFGGVRMCGESISSNNESSDGTVNAVERSTVRRLLSTPPPPAV